MPGITQAQLDALKTALIARWNAGLAVAPNDWQKIARLIKSSSKSNTYEWLSQFPSFREWVGSRLHKVLKERAYIVLNREFEDTVDIPRTDIEDDHIGQYGSVAESLGMSLVDLKNRLVFDLLAKGFDDPCYDGQAFFDLDHPIYPNEDGSGTAFTVSNMQEGQGAPWYLLCTKRAASPLFLQERMVGQFESQNTPASDAVYNLGVYSYGGRWRGEAAYGFWQCAFGSKAELNASNFNAAYVTMMKFVGDGRRLLGIVPDLLVTGPDNLAAAEQLLKAQQNPNGASNTNYNKVGLLCSPWVGGAQ